MSRIADPPGPITDYDAPAWVVTVLGVSLGVIGLAHSITHPEPLSVRVFEGLLVTVPAAIIVYGGHWITTRPLDRADRWIVVGWALGGAVITVALVAGYVLSERFSGGIVTESGQLALFGAVSGSLIALLAVISTQRRYHVPDAPFSTEDSADADGIESSSRTTIRRELSDVGSRLPGAKLSIIAVGIYRNEGLRSLTALSWLYVNHKLADMGVLRGRSYHGRNRTDGDDRWEMIVPDLADTDRTALDFGCARGFFTAKLADEGLSVTGIDADEERIEAARRAWAENERIEFAVRHLDRRTVSELPSVDVVLLLTFHHLWCSFFRRDDAEEVLRELATRSNKMFFEAPGEASHMFEYVGDRPLGDDESIAEYYSVLLTSILDERVVVEYLGEAEYPSHTTRADPLLLIDCREYTN